MIKSSPLKNSILVETKEADIGQCSGVACCGEKPTKNEGKKGQHM